MILRYIFHLFMELDVLKVEMCYNMVEVRQSKLLKNMINYAIM